MYGAGFEFNYFPFIGAGFFLTVLILGGLYSTILAMLVNAIFPQKHGTTAVIIGIMCFLIAFLVFGIIGIMALYDTSIFNVFLRILFRCLFPFVHIVYLLMFLFDSTVLEVTINAEALDYSLT